MKPPRPFSVTLLSLLVLLLTVHKIVRLVLVLRDWAFYSELFPFNPAYLALSGLVWAVIGLPVAYGIWFGSPWSPRVIRMAAFVYTIYYWLEFFFLVDLGERHENWPFLVVVNLVMLLWIFWVLSREKVCKYFGEDNEQRSENRETA
jgi:hypothetical protein